MEFSLPEKSSKSLNSPLFKIVQLCPFVPFRSRSFPFVPNRASASRRFFTFVPGIAYQTMVTRIVIYPKDIQLITGKSERYGRYLMEKIKIHLGKEKHHLVTVQEFCNYTGIQYEQVVSMLPG